MWIPEAENLKIPVAIKELHPCVPLSETKELLSEARVMASISHPCCISIIGICLTEMPMLITQLMPLGSLLNYVRQNEANIRAEEILNWCKQLAMVGVHML